MEMHAEVYAGLMFGFDCGCINILLVNSNTTVVSKYNALNVNNICVFIVINARNFDEPERR